MHLKHLKIFWLFITACVLIQTITAETLTGNADEEGAATAKGNAKNVAKRVKRVRKVKVSKKLLERPQAEEPKPEVADLDDLENYDYNNYDEGKYSKLILIII